MQDLIKALQSKEMMDAYLELNKTEDIINEIRDYAETQAIKQIITGNEPAHPFTAATENELLSCHITGLTILQDFSARAMQGFLSSSNGWAAPSDFPEISKRSVAAAYSLIECLNK